MIKINGQARTVRMERCALGEAACSLDRESFVFFL